jgi:hypothetical protein
MTPRELTPPLVSCGLVAFATASHVWLASPLDPTPWPVLQNVRHDTGSPPRTTTSRLIPSADRSFRALSLHRRLISGSFNLPSQGAFQLSITLLLRYRSRVMFSLGGGCPPDSREISDPRYSRTGHVLSHLKHGTITLLGPPFQESCYMRVGLKGRLTTPHLPALSGGIRFRLCCFHSPLLTASRFGFFSCPYADVSTQGVPDPYGSSHEWDESSH